MTDIGPNPLLNTWAAGLISCLALLPLYLGIDSLRFLGPGERGFSFVCLGVAGLILLWAAWLWQRPPMNAAWITFHEGGFRLATRQVFRGNRDFDLSWEEIPEITQTNGGLYGGRRMRIHRQGGKPPAMLAPAWTEADSAGIMAAFAGSAEAAGFHLEQETGFWRGMVRERWVVRKRA